MLIEVSGDGAHVTRKKLGQRPAPRCSHIINALPQVAVSNTRYITDWHIESVASVMSVSDVPAVKAETAPVIPPPDTTTRLREHTLA